MTNTGKPVEKIHSINVSRIEWYCEDAGVSLYQLADGLGISAKTIDLLRDEGRGLTFNQLRLISDFFGKGVLFFLEEGEVNVQQAHTPQFRSIANQKPGLSQKLKSLIERAEKQRSVYLALRDELDENWEQFSHPELPPRENISRVAEAARKWLGLREHNDFGSYRSAVESKGILVFRSNGYAGKWQIPAESPILGFNLYSEECPLIVVRKEKSEARQSFTLMHELGHVLLHRQSSIDDKYDMYSQRAHEREANSFAGQLLVPDRYLETISDRDRPQQVADCDSWLEAQRTAWGVSGHVILLRLLDKGRIDQEYYQAYRRWLDSRPDSLDGRGNRMYRHREPKHIFGDAFVRTVFDALSSDRITLNKASKYLDSIKIRDIHQLEDYYAGV